MHYHGYPLEVQFLCDFLQITRLLGSGSALQRNPILQHHAKGVFNLPLEMRAQADAPLGAALAVRGLGHQTHVCS